MENKVERKIFLGMEVRVVNNECDYNHQGGVYLIKFTGDKMKIGVTNNINTRLSSYKPYRWLINEIWLFKTDFAFEVEQELLNKVKLDLFYGKEWLVGDIEGKDFVNMCKEIYGNINKDRVVAEARLEFSENDILEGIGLLFPKRKREEFDFVIDTIYTTLMYAKTMNSNLNKFIDFYKNTSKKNKDLICNVLIINGCSVEKIIEMIDIYFGEGVYILGRALYINSLLSNFKEAEVRDFVLGKFINAFEFTNSHKLAGEMALNLAKKRYNIK